MLYRVAAEDNPALTDEERDAYLEPFLSYVTATLTNLGLTAQIHDINPWQAKLSSSGVDINVLLTSPALKKGVLTFSWNIGAGDQRWVELLTSVDPPAAVNFFWRGSWYRVVAARLPLLLQALASLQNTRLRRASTPPFNQVISVGEAESVKLAAQIAIGEPDASGEEETAEVDDATRLSRLRNLMWLRDHVDEDLRDVLQRLGNTGWIRLVTPDAAVISRGDYASPDLSTGALQLAAKLSRGKYKGEVGSGYNTVGQLVLTLTAPFPILLVCRRGSGTALAPVAAGISLGDLLLAAPAAQGQELTMGVLALGLAAGLARRSPEKAVKRGRIAQALSPTDTLLVRKAISSPETAS